MSENQPQKPEEPQKEKKAVKVKKSDSKPISKRNASKKSASKKDAKKKSKNAQATKSRFTSLLAVLIVFLAFYLGITLFIGALIVYSFNDTVENTEIYSLNVVYDEKTLHKISAEKANNEFGLYIPFSYLTEIGAFGMAGGGDDVTLFIVGTENRIECTVNSSLMIINDNPVRISAPLLYEDGEYLVPIVLLENYINGIDVNYDDKKMVCVVSSDIGKTDIELKLLLPEALEAGNFRDEDKYYNYGTSEETSE